MHLKVCIELGET